MLVTGSREWNDAELLEGVLDGIWPTKIGHGLCRGADEMADEWAVRRGVPVLRFPAEWRPDGVFDPGAGRRRNQVMLDALRWDLVVAFKDGFDFTMRGPGGTEHMVRIALRAHVPVRVVNAAGDVVYLPLQSQLPLS